MKTPRDRRHIDWSEIRKSPANLFALLGATFFGSGLLPQAPGTWGTLAALPLWYATRDLPTTGRLLAWTALAAWGVWSSKVFDEVNRTQDNQNIVMDEATGVGITAQVNAARNGLLLTDTTGQTGSLRVASGDATDTAEKLGVAVDAAVAAGHGHAAGNREQGKAGVDAAAGRAEPPPQGGRVGGLVDEAAGLEVGEEIVGHGHRQTSSPAKGWAGPPSRGVGRALIACSASFRSSQIGRAHV